MGSTRLIIWLSTRIAPNTDRSASMFCGMLLGAAGFSATVSLRLSGY